MPYSFVICDDHPLINQSIDFFFSQKGTSCFGKFTSNKELISYYSNSTSDILICDLNIDHENTFEVLKGLIEKRPSLYVIIFSAYSDRIYIQKAKEIGVALYFSKTTELEDLYSKIDLNNREFFTNCQFESEKKMFISSELSFGKKDLKLSDQEKKIVTLILAGITSEEIAKKLFISKFTVDTHRKNINKKLNVNGIIHLQEKVIKYNLL